MRDISIYWNKFNKKNVEDQGGKTKGLSLFGGCVRGRPLHASTWFLYFLNGWSEEKSKEGCINETGEKGERGGVKS